MEHDGEFERHQQLYERFLFPRPLISKEESNSILSSGLSTFNGFERISSIHCVESCVSSNIAVMMTSRTVSMIINASDPSVNELSVNFGNVGGLC